MILPHAAIQEKDCIHVERSTRVLRHVLIQVPVPVLRADSIGPLSSAILLVVVVVSIELFQVPLHGPV
jgi:hypothetical protein